MGKGELKMMTFDEKGLQTAKEILDEAEKKILALAKDDGKKPLSEDDRNACEKKWQEEHKDFFEAMTIEENFIKSQSLIDKFDEDIANALCNLLRNKISAFNKTLWNIVESVVERNSVPETNEETMEQVRRIAKMDGLESQDLTSALKNFKYSSVITKGPFDFKKINHVFDVDIEGNSNVQDIANLLTFSLLQKTVWIIAKKYGYDKAHISSFPALRKEAAK